MRAIITTLVVGGLFVAIQGMGQAQTSRPYSVASRAVTPNSSQGQAAMDAAARDGQYLFVFFWKANDKQTQAMRGVFQSALTQWSESARSISIKITDPSEKSLVNRFGVRRAPMPLVASYIPARRAAGLDPVATFQEV